MKNNQLMAVLILGGVAAYYFLNQKQTQSYAPKYSNLPPPPAPTSPNYQVWVDSILKTFGAVSDLWKPGGPFYKQNVPKPPTTIV
jgi:hypothetical protein